MRSSFMANEEHLDILRQGVEAWNQWRKEHPNIQPDLASADLNRADLRGANLSNANLSDADLHDTNLSNANINSANLSNADLYAATLIRTSFVGTNLSEVDFVKANISEADLSHTQLIMAKLIKANLRHTKLIRANLTGADLYEANLFKANLRGARLVTTTLVNANLNGADLTGCSIFGISAWNVQLEGAIQDNLIITPDDEPTITVDNLKIAQFIYLLLNNEEIREVIDTIAKKAVLILGRFTSERKTVLDVLKKSLRTHGYLPILFDYDKPSTRNFTETVRTLAHLSRFIIADLTDPSSIPQELQAIIPTLAVPVQPVLVEGKREYAMFVDFLKTYHWVLPTHYYRDQADLLATLKEQVIEPAEQKAQELASR